MLAFPHSPLAAMELAVVPNGSISLQSTDKSTVRLTSHDLAPDALCEQAPLDYCLPVQLTLQKHRLLPIPNNSPSLPDALYDQALQYSTCPIRPSCYHIVPPATTSQAT